MGHLALIIRTPWQTENIFLYCSHAQQFSPRQRSFHRGIYKSLFCSNFLLKILKSQRYSLKWPLRSFLKQRSRMSHLAALLYISDLRPCPISHLVASTLSYALTVEYIQSRIFEIFFSRTTWMNLVLQQKRCHCWSINVDRLFFRFITASQKILFRRSLQSQRVWTICFLFFSSHPSYSLD